MLALALIVGGETGAVDLQVAIHQGIDHSVHGGRLFIDQIAAVAGADAGFLPHNDRPAALDDVGQFPVGNGHGAATEEQTRCVGRCYPLTCGDPCFNLIAEGVDAGCKAHRVVIKGDLVDQQGIATGNREPDLPGEAG